MNCKIQWSSKFIVDNLNRSYIDNDYKKHRKNLLVEKEISRTSELMNLVHRTKLLEDSQSELKIIQKNYDDARKLMYNALSTLNEKKLEIHRIKTGEDSKSERKQFIMPCPANNCKGYLSTQYKCEICKLYTCPDCFEVIGYSKDEPHECKQENIQSAQMIKKETKGCPKCGVRIFKISGCDQMWCTECKVAFSWNTGKIVLTGNIHNPHYYNYLQQTGGNAAPRNPGDIICGGLIPYHQFNQFTRSLIRFTNSNFYNIFITKSQTIKNYFQDKKITTFDNFITIINSIHRHINHITNYDLFNARNKVRILQNHDADTVQYILNRFTKQQLSDKIFKNDIQRKKYNELLNIYELLSVVGIERIRDIYEYFTHHILYSKKYEEEKIIQLICKIINHFNDYENLIMYSNVQLATISYTYNLTVTVYKFNDFNLDFYTNKFKQSDVSKFLEQQKLIQNKLEKTNSSNNHSESSSSYL
tara:strand:- start:10758 stop:12179 length:1422 start_codon:yes stop_codon:yes gene_type:complete